MQKPMNKTKNLYLANYVLVLSLFFSGCINKPVNSLKKSTNSISNSVVATNSNAKLGTGKATNAIGTGSLSPNSNAITPAAPVVTPVTTPPRSWMIGTNDLLILSSSIAQTKLANLPTNVISYNSKNSSIFNSDILDLAANHHVGLFREIIPVSMIAPTSIGDFTYWADIKKTLMLYRSYNLRLVLSFGMPLPEWMNHGGDWSTWCPIPSDTTRWPALKNNLALSVGTFLVQMANDPDLKDWMRTHVYIEGFNEFDSVGAMQSSKCNPINATLSGQHAADYHNGIIWTLNKYNVSLQMLMPSMVMGNPDFLSSYYKAHGSGLPNIHIYTSRVSGKSDYEQFMTIFNSLKAVLPADLKNKIFITELGIPTTDLGCSTGGLSENEVNIFYNLLLKDSTLESSTLALIMWRLYELPQIISESPCESYFGWKKFNSPSYKKSTSEIFNYIQNLSVEGR